MAVTTMESISSLISKLANSPEGTLRDLQFTPGDEFRWNHTDRTITYDTDDPHAPLFLLHEYSHAKLGHATYNRDVELVTMERDAWHQTRQLAPLYDVEVDDDIIEDSLDTYRDWLHARSACPKCESTGIQTGARQYTCLACRHLWRVNEARQCALRRYDDTK